MDPNARPPRKVGIADHIWDAFDEMASSMGSDRDALINQAMFMFARLNGFLEMNGTAKPMNGAAAAKPAPARGAPMLAQAPPPGQRATRMPEEKPQARMDDDPQRREVAERVLETAAELERLIKGKNNPPEPSGEEAPAEEAEDMGMDVAEEQSAEGSEEGGLYLMSEGGDMDKITKERFVIGRGKHCDFVINSGKVSREHAVVMRDGSDFYIEDLGSSNGTWFNKQRIKRRKIEDGDEYYICSERVKFVMR
jgi:hypothetical protein